MTAQLQRSGQSSDSSLASLSCSAHADVSAEALQASPVSSALKPAAALRQAARAPQTSGSAQTSSAVAPRQAAGLRVARQRPGSGPLRVAQASSGAQGSAASSGHSSGQLGLPIAGGLRSFKTVRFAERSSVNPLTLKVGSRYSAVALRHFELPLAPKPLTMQTNLRLAPPSSSRSPVLPAAPNP